MINGYLVVGTWQSDNVKSNSQKDAIYICQGSWHRTDFLDLAHIRNGNI